MKIKLNRFFKALRKAGYFAKQDFLCCQSCGWAAMDDKEAEKAVFYHHQDTPDIKAHKSIMLCWSGDGIEIVTLAKAAGLAVKWDGTKETRIEVSDIN